MQGFDHRAVTLAKTYDFSAFLNHPYTIASLMAQPYASYVTDTAGNMRATDFILLEHAGTDLEPLFTHLGFHFDLPIANTSDRARDWRLFFTDADAALIGQLCAADIARSGYCFALFAAR